MESCQVSLSSGTGQTKQRTKPASKRHQGLTVSGINDRISGYGRLFVEA